MDSVRGQHERFVALGAAVDALQDVLDVGMVRFSGNHCVKKESRDISRVSRTVLSHIFTPPARACHLRERVRFGMIHYVGMVESFTVSE